MNKFENTDWLSLISSYLIFAFVYSGIIWFIWQFLFAPFFYINFSYLQILGAYTITRLMFGNTNTSYISNFYSPKPMDLNKMDDYLKDFQEKLDEESRKIEREYEEMDKRKDDKE